MRDVQLRNGSTAKEVMVSVAMVSIRTLRVNNPGLFLELFFLCREPDFEPTTTAYAELRARRYVDPTSDRPAQIFCDVMSSAVKLGEKFTTQVIDPVVGTAP